MFSHKVSQSWLLYKTFDMLQIKFNSSYEAHHSKRGHKLLDLEYTVYDKFQNEQQTYEQIRPAVTELVTKVHPSITSLYGLNDYTITKLKIIAFCDGFVATYEPLLFLVDENRSCSFEVL